MVTTRKARAVVTSASRRRPQSEPDSPVKKFFKLILPSTMKKNMMRIPPRFVQLHGSRLSQAITLETPVGFNRSIKLKRIGKEIWFEGGWSEFAEAHSIREGYLLLFEYKGNSSFRVIIFNKTASEIEYPLDAVHIIDSDDEIIEVTEDNAESVNDDIQLVNILKELDAINSMEVLEEENSDIRVFRGKQSF